MPTYERTCRHEPCWRAYSLVSGLLLATWIDMFRKNVAGNEVLEVIPIEFER